jgi:hypothetical protein
MLLRVQTSARSKPNALHADISSQPNEPTDVADKANRPHFLPDTEERLSDHLTDIEKDTLTNNTPNEAPWQLVRLSKRRP